MLKSKKEFCKISSNREQTSSRLNRKLSSRIIRKPSRKPISRDSSREQQ